MSKLKGNRCDSFCWKELSTKAQKLSTDSCHLNPTLWKQMKSAASFNKKKTVN